MDLESMKQTELTKMLIENIKTDSPDESSSKNISYAEAVKLSPILLKPNSSQTVSRDQINGKMSQALVKSKWLVQNLLRKEKYY